jgi:hypothetical protein
MGFNFSKARGFERFDLRLPELVCLGRFVIPLADVGDVFLVEVS